MGIGCPRNIIKKLKKEKKGWSERKYLLDYVETLKEQGWFPKDIEVDRKMISGANIPVGMGMSCTVGDRMMVVGDAGGFVSPLSGEGLYYALDSGRLAAESLDVLFNDGNFQKQDLMHYHRAWSSKWGDDLEWLKVGWHLLMVMPNSLIKYAALDEETKEFFTHMFVGSMPAAKIKNKVEKKTGEVLKEVEPEDLLRFGLIPEFIGRLPIISTLEDLDEQTLIQILEQPKNSLTKQYCKLFDIEGVKLNFAKDALKAIAEKAIKRKTGARGLRSIIEEILLETMFELPSMEGVEEIVVNREVVNGNSKPLMIYSKKSTKENKIAN